jgi:hypothetical protein
MEDMIFPCGTHVLMWRLDEEPSRLLALCRERGIPVDDLVDQPVKRQREKVAERLLLCSAFGSPVTMCHDAQGAPSVEGRDVNISITHTPQLVALAWNERVAIGIDAERTDRQQVLKVRNKFLNSSELQFIAPDDLDAHIIAWTAKEAVIKAERNSAIDWTDGICLEPFIPETTGTTLVARCGNRRYRLTCRAVEGHYVTVAVPVTA